MTEPNDGYYPDKLSESMPNNEPIILLRKQEVDERDIFNEVVQGLNPSVIDSLASRQHQ